jgi:membrane protease YdiL (CAAX protease family)
VTAAVELVLAAAFVVTDRIVPTLVILVLMAISLGVRHQRLGDLGLVRPTATTRMVTSVTGIVAVWTVVQLALIMPIVEHATGSPQDVSQFDDLEGNLGLLLAFLALSWTLAAFGEELAYRGFVQRRATDAFAPWHAATAVAMVVTAALFGLAHTEQGTVGVIITFFDSLLFSALAWHYRTLWAAIVAHGVSNTTGLTAFYLVGPISGWW